MSRPLSPAQVAKLTENAVTAGECLILAARNGTRAGFTSLDVAQAIDLGFGAGVETCSDSMLLSAITLAATVEASFAEVRGPLGPVLTRAAVENGVWKDAEAFLVRVWPGVAGWAPLLRGKVRECRAEDPDFVLELRNQADQLGAPLERLITAYCHWRYGDPDTCQATVASAAATVEAVTGTLTLAVSYAGTYADGYFQFGEAEFTSGALAGVVAEALYGFTETAPGLGTIELAEPLEGLAAVGDTLTLRRGCPRTRTGCIERQGHALRFGGEPDVPGSEKVWQYPNPGGGS